MLNLSTNQVFILLALKVGDMYGLEIIAFLKQQFVTINAGSLYNSLNSLESKGLLISYTIHNTSDLKVNKRKYYKISEKGAKEAKSIRIKINDLFNLKYTDKSNFQINNDENEMLIVFLDNLEKATILTTLDESIRLPFNQSDICKYYKNEKGIEISNVAINRRINRNIQKLTALITHNKNRWPYLRNHSYPFNN